MKTPGQKFPFRNRRKGRERESFRSTRGGKEPWDIMVFFTPDGRRTEPLFLAGRVLSRFHIQNVL